jgi:metallo-beta-lactamase class B
MRWMLRCTLVLFAACAAAQTSSTPENWRKPFPAHRIAGNVYYVGTYDLACFLITTPQGQMLINTGLEDSAAMIRAGIEQLGFKFRDIKILLTMQAHYDHVAALAQVKRLTGASVAATEGDAPVLEDGGRSDFHFGPKQQFAPVKVDRILRDGDKVALGGTELTVHLTPGHTKGSASYSMRVADQGRSYNVLFANMETINPGVKLVGNSKYPQIADDYARALRVQKSLPCDIFLAAHASQYSLHEKYKGKYDPAAFVDPEGYKRAVTSYERAYLDQLAREKR